MNAQVGETVTLAVNIKGAAKTGVTFEIKLGDTPLASVPGTVKDGTATGRWKVDLQGNAPPKDVTFTATSGGTAVSSGTLHVVAAVPVVGPLGPSAVNQGLILLANGILQIDVGSKIQMESTVSAPESADVEVFVDDVPPGDITQPGKPLGPAVFPGPACRAASRRS